MMEKPLLLCISLFLSLEFVGAQLPSIKISIDKRKILIGEYLQYKVDVSIPLNTYTINWLNFPDSINHFETVKRSKIDTIEGNGVLDYKQVITLTSFDSGLQVIPSLPVNFQSLKADTTLKFLSDSFIVSVSYSPLDSVKTFHDIKTIIEVEDKWPLWMWIAAAALLLIIIGLIVFLIRYFRKRKKPANFLSSKLSPLEEAMQSLQELEKQRLLARGEVKQYHTKLTNIFKRYVSRKMDFNMLNLTSSEILMRLNQTLLSKENTSLLANSLVMADAVKFAKYIPASIDSEEALFNIRKLIEQIDQLIISE